MSKKKFLIISIIVFVLIISFIIVYFLFVKKPPAPPPTFPSIEELEKEKEKFLKERAKKRLQRIGNAHAISPTIKNNKVIFYSPEGIFEANFNGSNVKKISSLVIPNLIEIVWSKNKRKAWIRNYDEDYNIKTYIYDYLSSKAYPLVDNIRALDFNPVNSSEIIFHYLNRKKNVQYIGKANIDLTNIKKIIDLNIKISEINWLNEDTALIKTAPSGLTSNFALLLDIKNQKLTNLISDTNGLIIKPSLDGSKLIYSTTDEKGKNPSISIMDLKTKAKKNLFISTIAEKCVFSQDNKTLFCAVPKAISDNIIIPDDYYKGKLDQVFEDQIFKIDTQTKKKKIISQDIDIPINAYNLFLSPQEDYLFFINKRDGFLYSYKL